MLKFITLDDIRTTKSWFLCQDLTIGNKTLTKDLQINDTVVRFVKEHLEEIDYSRYVIVANEPTEEKAIINFITDIIKKFIDEEVKCINEKYYNIITLDLSDRMVIMISELFKLLDFKYQILLITNPVILKKSISLSIMSFYFGVKMDVKYKELEDLIYSSLLVNLNLCNNNSFTSIENNKFLVGYKEAIIKSSYDMIADDRKLSANVKRIVRYANITSQTTNDIYYRKTVDGKKEAVLKDITLEIIQLSNDILTYNFNSNTIKNVYEKSPSYANPFLRPIIDGFVTDMHTRKRNHSYKSFSNIFVSIMNLFRDKMLSDKAV